MNISIIIPLFNEDESLKELADWIVRVTKEQKLSYEIIFIDDGSTDNSWTEIEQLTKLHKEVRGIKLRRNYGKSAALYCGFKEVQGDVVITMDADLQDSPDEIPQLYDMIVNEGYDLVSGWKKKRFDPISKRLPSRLFNGMARFLSKIELHDFNCGLKSYKNEVIKNVEVYGEMHRYIPMLAKEMGFVKIGEKIVQHQERKYGKTKFGIERFIRGFLDLLTVWFMTTFGKRPMHLFGFWGMLMFLFGFITSIIIGLQKIYYLSQQKQLTLIADNPYFYLALTTMILGTQLFLTGFIAELVYRNSTIRDKYQIEKYI